MIPIFPGIVKCFFLDASAMVKLFVDENEPGFEQIRDYFNSLNAAFFTTNFCYFETLSTLKRKWQRSEITQSEYLRHCRLLFAYKEERKIKIKEYPLKDLHDFRKLECMTETHGIDISDALQLLSIKETILSKKFVVEESETTLITADDGLAKAAENEGIKHIQLRNSL